MQIFGVMLSQILAVEACTVPAVDYFTSGSSCCYDGISFISDEYQEFEVAAGCLEFDYVAGDETVLKPYEAPNSSSLGWCPLVGSYNISDVNTQEKWGVCQLLSVKQDEVNGDDCSFGVVEYLGVVSLLLLIMVCCLEFARLA